MWLKEKRGGSKLTIVFGCELGEESGANVCSQFGPKAAEIAVDDAEVEGHPRDVRSSGRDVGACHKNGMSAVGFAKMNDHTVIRALSSNCIRGLRRERGERFKGRCISSIAFDSPERLCRDRMDLQGLIFQHLAQGQCRPERRAHLGEPAPQLRRRRIFLTFRVPSPARTAMRLPGREHNAWNGTLTLDPRRGYGAEVVDWPRVGICDKVTG